VHRAAAADDRHIAGHLAVDQRAAPIGDGALLGERQKLLQVECAGAVEILSHGRLRRIQHESMFHNHR
jgi:hypothetical protein